MKNIIEIIDNLINRVLDLEKKASKSSLDILTVYPVGAIYMSVVNTSPATLFGGTWSAWGSGKVPVGVDTGDTDFNTVEKTGGAKTHKHKGYGDADSGETAGDLRAAIGATNNNSAAIGYLYGSAINPNTGTAPTGSFYGITGSGYSLSNWNHFTYVYGYTSTKSNLMPYITCYMWKRTA